MSSLIAPEESSSGVHLGSNDGSTARCEASIDLQRTSPQHSGIRGAADKESPENTIQADEPPDGDSPFSCTSTKSSIKGTVLTEEDDPMDLHALKEQVGSTHSLCLKIENMASEWDYIDSSSTASKGEPIQSPTSHSMMATNGDSGIGIHHNEYDDSNKHSTKWGNKTPTDEAELPERLI